MKKLRTKGENKVVRQPSVRSRIEPWVEKNPLRKWRRDNNMSQQDTALQLGVSWLSISFWEKGGTRPNDENMKSLSLLLGILVRDLKEEWDQWYEQRPLASQMTLANGS